MSNAIFLAYFSIVVNWGENKSNICLKKIQIYVHFQLKRKTKRNNGKKILD